MDIKIKKLSGDEAKLEHSYPCKVIKESEMEVIVDWTVQIPDRDKEILLVEPNEELGVKGVDLTEYNKNKVMLADHDFSVRSLVGSFEWVKPYPASKPDRVRGKPVFSSVQFAKDIETYVKEGHLKTLSHTYYGWEYVDDKESIRILSDYYGFDPDKVGKAYTYWGPLEVSWIVIPSNTGTIAHLVQAGVLKSKQFKTLAEYEVGAKPYPNEHSARLKNPDLFDRETFRRKNDGTIYGSKKIPESIAVLWGKLKEHNKPEDNPIPQALRFPTKNWTVNQAKEWLKNNNISYIKFEPATGKEIGEEIKDKYAEYFSNSVDGIEFIVNELDSIGEKINKLKLQVAYLKQESDQDEKPPSGDQDEDELSDEEALKLVQDSILDYGGENGSQDPTEDSE